MPLRPPAGFIRPGFDPLKNPNAPTIGTATAGDASASVTFTPPANVGGSAISQYQVVAYTGGTPAGNTAGTASPISVTGLTNGTAYTFAVWALNTYGPGPFSAMSGSVTPAAARGLFGGGYTTDVSVNTIDYVSITTTGNALDFGDLTVSRDGLGACSSATRGVWAGGYASGNNSNVMDYVTIASTGNAIDFGDTIGTVVGCGCSNSTRGIFGRGTSSWYITIASTGNTVSFGNFSGASDSDAACSSSTRAVFAMQNNTTQFLTIATTGDGTSFGNLTLARNGMTGCSSSTRGIFAGGAYSPSTNLIEYITIASTGNAIDFGDLQLTAYEPAATSSQTRGLISGGFNSGGTNNPINIINYITIASTGNALDFGDLTQSRSGLAGCSNVQGGLQ